MKDEKPLVFKGFEDDLARLRSVEEKSRLGDSNPGPMLYESIDQSTQTLIPIDTYVDSKAERVAKRVATPSDMAQLLTQLAALPADQREAIAKLLMPSTEPASKSSAAISDERCALDDRKPSS